MSGTTASKMRQSVHIKARPPSPSPAVLSIDHGGPAPGTGWSSAQGAPQLSPGPPNCGLSSWPTTCIPAICIPPCSFRTECEQEPRFTMKVYISSTYQDLVDHRAAVD